VSGEHWEVFTHGGRNPTGLNAVDYAGRGGRQGRGRILLTSMDRDGAKSGYDLELHAQGELVGRRAGDRLGRRREHRHLIEAVEAGADAVLAASIFHFGEITIGEAKRRHGRRQASRSASRSPPVSTNASPTSSPPGRDPSRAAVAATTSASYTAQLLGRPRPRRQENWAKKPSEPSSAAARATATALIAESADLVYHWTRRPRAAGISLDDVAESSRAAMGTSVLQEKARAEGLSPAASASRPTSRRPVAAVAAVGLRQARPRYG
jgi:phosphoribosyl-ATP pyrophosphohydrolase